MRLAFVDNLSVGGGLSRFSYMLCKSLLEADRSLFIDYWVNGDNLARTPELLELKGNIQIRLMDIHKPLSFRKRALNKVGRNFNKRFYPERDGYREIEEKIKGYDVAYFPSAHMMPRVRLNIPVVGTLHDFNWKYFFGSATFSADFVERMDTSIVHWMNEGYTVCSSQDVVAEARKLYPDIKRYPEVVHIAPVVFTNEITDKSAEDILKKLEIDYPYLLFPGNFIAHKNHLNLIAAFAILKAMPGRSNLKLLFSGMGSDKVRYGIAERRGLRVLAKSSGFKGFDVRGLGYLQNNVIDVLIKKATLVVSPSLYEAICTPGMDAWNFGTPTAISDIPPFREHEAVWGIKSAFFDPMDPQNMADVMNDYLENYDRAKSDGKISEVNIRNYTWADAARGYLKVFQKASVSV